MYGSNPLRLYQAFVVSRPQSYFLFLELFVWETFTRTGKNAECEIQRLSTGTTSSVGKQQDRSEIFSLRGTLNVGAYPKGDIN